MYIFCFMYTCIITIRYSLNNTHSLRRETQTISGRRYISIFIAHRYFYLFIIIFFCYLELSKKRGCLLLLFFLYKDVPDTFLYSFIIIIIILMRLYMTYFCVFAINK